MHSIVLSSVTCLAPPYFPTLSHKWNDFRKMVIEYKRCISILTTISIRKISYFKMNSASYCNKCKKSLCQVPVILDRF